MRPLSTGTEQTHRRVVITGIGLITPYAVGREASWQNLLSAQAAIQPLEALSQQFNRPLVGGVIPDESLSSTSLSGNSPLQREPSLTLALHAAEEAIADANLDLDQLETTSAGCVIGSSKGGMASFAQLAAAPEQAPPELWLQCFPGATSQFIAGHYNLKAAALTPVSACATGFASIMRGAELIRDGICETVFAGSTDASLLPAVLGSFHRMGVLASRLDSPAEACRPYDIRRNGFVVGEGAGILILESLERARKRGATPYAEWCSGNLGADSTHLMQFDPQAKSLSRLITHTLDRSSLSPADIDYINLHGTGTQINDVYETHAIRSAFGKSADSVHCSSLKGGMGHLLGAAGSVELAFTLLAMRDGVVPPTLNLQEPDPECDLNYTPLTAVTREIKSALKLSFGFGGHLAAGVVRKYEAGR